MSSVAQGVPFATMTNKVHVAPKRFLSTSSTSMESALEDMLMTEMPPLDLGSDSGEDPDDEHTMDTLSYSPAPSLPSSTASPMAPRADHKNMSFSPPYSSSTLDPISILHTSKTCRTSHTKTVAFSHPSFEVDLESKSAGPRPTLSFDLDLHCQEEQEEQDVPQQPSMTDLMETLMSIESNSASHSYHQDKGPQDSQSSLLSMQLKDQASPSKSPLSTSYSFEPLEAHGQDHSDRLSCIENHITPEAGSSAQHSSWATTTTKIVDDDIDKVENEPLPPQETINRVCVSSEMLVALIDRPSELEALAAIHSDLFNLMYNSLSPSAQSAFKTLLFTPRDVLSDRDWMQAISRPEFLPCVLQKFKALVGWMDIDDTNDNGRAWVDDDDEYGYEDSLEQVEIKWFRDLDGFSVEVFEKCYPQFFVNARERLQGRRMSLGGDHRDRYVVFCETLGLSRQALACDNAWTRRINGCLEKHPELLLQFKEIVAYEVENDD